MGDNPVKRKEKQPVTKGRAKVPVVLQMENMECGAASLAMVLAYYGKWVPLSAIRELCGVSRDGVKMSTIARTARTYGLEAKGYRYGLKEFFEKADFPCIVHWNFTHFVVVCGYRGKKVYLNDPAVGEVTISRQEFDEAFTGVCVRFRPGEQFEATGSQKSVFSYMKEYLKGTGSSLALFGAASVIIAVAGILLPTASRVFFDRVLSGRSPELLTTLLLVLGVLCLIQLIVGIVQAGYQLKLFGVLAVRESSRYMWHVFHMPSPFFFQRQPGDLQQNEAASRGISETIIQCIIPLLINTFMMIFYAFAMIQYSLLLSLLGFLAVLVNLILTGYLSKRRINIIRVMRRDVGKLMSSSMAGVSMIETIKACGSENAYFGRWSGYQANVNDQYVRFEKESQILGSIPGALNKLASVVILCVGVYLIIQGQFTRGMVTAFQAFLNAFLDPALQMVRSEQQIQEMRTDMERIEDVMVYPESDILGEEDPDREYHKLRGDIELNHITFGYSPLEEPLIRDLSFSVKAGSSVAVVGSSGCGKSTILSLVSGLYKPWEGTVSIDGRPLAEIPGREFRGSVAVIDQTIDLFKDTIANNIKMWDESIEDYEMILAARDAHIHDEIMKKENGYNHMLLEGGADFSGGQRQRIEIARALATDPSVIVMDEATSALDAVTENQVVKSIHERGITCLIVAHRLSTIRDCDEIIVLDRGKIAERGTHEQLMALEGLYCSLVKNN